MNYPDALSGLAICHMEGCEFRDGSICIRCGERLRCLCGKFIRSDQLDSHVKTCAAVETQMMGCPICEGGQGSACSDHFL